MTNKKLISILKSKIKRVKKQKEDLNAINTDSIKNMNARTAIEITKNTSILIAFGRLTAYREIYRELKHSK